MRVRKAKRASTWSWCADTPASASSSQSARRSYSTQPSWKWTRGPAASRAAPSARAVGSSGFGCPADMKTRCAPSTRSTARTTVTGSNQS